MSERSKRNHLRQDGRTVSGIKSSEESVELEVFQKRNQEITDELANAIDKNDRKAVRKAINKRDNLRLEARKEMKRRDSNIAKDAFLATSSATEGIDERIVERAMANGSANFDVHYEKVPASLKNLPASDLQPEKVQKVSVELIVATQDVVRKNNSKEALDKAFEGILPVTDEKIILEVFNEITPQDRRQLSDDMAKFYTYVAITSPDPNIEDKLVGPALARAYVDYRATLKAYQLRQAS